MKTTETTSSTYDDSDQGVLDGTLGNRDVAQFNLNGSAGDCSLNEPMPVFDSTLIGVPFSAAGAEDEKYADGGLFCVLICTCVTSWVTIRQSYKVSPTVELSKYYRSGE